MIIILHDWPCHHKLDHFFHISCPHEKQSSFWCWDLSSEFTQPRSSFHLRSASFC